MKIISHRGNISGPDTALENNPAYIAEALKLGFDVEIDVWYTGNGFYLGHDDPMYNVDQTFLLNEKLWCHAKNLRALYQLMEIGAHCFWHEQDRVTITSRGYVWCYPNTNEFNSKSIALCFDADKKIPTNCYGVCTDYPNRITKIYDNVGN
jgi:hypothetical protein